MKIAIYYFSQHHGNTLKLLEAMTEGLDADLIPVTCRMAVRMDFYDAVGFASGIYYSKFHDTVLDFARNYLPLKKPVFWVYTYGAYRKGYDRSICEVLKEKQAVLCGGFGCPGFDTYGPLKWIGGIAKGRPNEKDCAAGKTFLQELCARLS